MSRAIARDRSTSPSSAASASSARASSAGTSAPALLLEVIALIHGDILSGGSEAAEVALDDDALDVRHGARVRVISPWDGSEEDLKDLYAVRAEHPDLSVQFTEAEPPESLAALRDTARSDSSAGRRASSAIRVRPPSARSTRRTPSPSGSGTSAPRWSGS